jgi:cytochrome c oxidase assembly factor CtaG
VVLPALAAALPGAGLPPLTAGRLLTSWTAPPAVLAGVAVLGGGYLVGVRRMRHAGLPWSARRTAPFLLGAVLLLLVGTSAVAVYDDTLFWTRAVQGVVLLVVAPMLLAAGAPLTLARATLPAPVVGRLGRVRRSRVARTVSSPGAVTIALIVPPFLLYLTGLYPLELRSAVVSGLVSVGLLAAGLLYVVSRLQIDPVPRETHHGLTLGIAIAEVVTDGVLGLVLWMGPLLAVGHYDAVARTWGPTPRDDQAIGAGVWWIGGDLAGLPFLGAIALRFAAADAREARRVDAELDAAERDAAARDAAALARVAAERDPAPGDPAVGDPAAGGGDGGEDPGARPRLWWEDDPRFADRFRRS